MSHTENQENLKIKKIGVIFKGKDSQQSPTLR